MGLLDGKSNGLSPSSEEFGTNAGLLVGLLDNCMSVGLLVGSSEYFLVGPSDSMDELVGFTVKIWFISGSLSECWHREKSLASIRSR